MSIKQIYIPSIKVKGTYIEEIGGESDKIYYPGNVVDVELGLEDFENKEDYHNVWILITKAVKKKIANGSTAS
jgi:hypothetical protein